MPATASSMPASFLAVMVSPRKDQPPSSTMIVLLWPRTWGMGGCVCVWGGEGKPERNQEWPRASSPDLLPLVL